MFTEAVNYCLSFSPLSQLLICVIYPFPSSHPSLSFFLISQLLMMPSFIFPPCPIYLFLLLFSFFSLCVRIFVFLSHPLFSPFPLSFSFLSHLLILSPYIFSFISPFSIFLIFSTSSYPASTYLFS